MDKLKKECTLYPDNIDYVMQIKEKSGARSFSAALDSIISDHRKFLIDDTIIVRAFWNEFESRYGNLLNRFKVAVNAADFNTQIIIELLNTLMLYLEINDSYLTSTLKSNVLCDAEADVKKKIAYLKQLKDDKI